MPEDRPVPAFITGERWTFAGIQGSAASLPGFNRLAAELGVHLNGFHLFQVADPMWTPRGTARPSADLVVTRQKHGPKPVVEVKMKESIKQRVEQQSCLMAAMMVHLEVDAVTAMREADGAEFAAATFKCLMCDHSGECCDWLASPNRESDAPTFCPSADFFNCHRMRTNAAGP